MIESYLKLMSMLKDYTVCPFMNPPDANLISKLYSVTKRKHLRE